MRLAEASARNPILVLSPCRKWTSAFSHGGAVLLQISLCRPPTSCENDAPCGQVKLIRLRKDLTRQLTPGHSFASVGLLCSLAHSTRPWSTSFSHGAVLCRKCSARIIPTAFAVSVLRAQRLRVRMMLGSQQKDSPRRFAPGATLCLLWLPSLHPLPEPHASLRLLCPIIWHRFRQCLWLRDDGQQFTQAFHAAAVDAEVVVPCARGGADV